MFCQGDLILCRRGHVIRVGSGLGDLLGIVEEVSVKLQPVLPGPTTPPPYTGSEAGMGTPTLTSMLTQREFGLPSWMSFRTILRRQPTGHRVCSMRHLVQDSNGMPRSSRRCRSVLVENAPSVLCGHLDSINHPPISCCLLPHIARSAFRDSLRRNKSPEGRK